MKLFLHVHTRDQKYPPVRVNLRSRDAWSEQDHPRGKPDNPGQFTSKGEGSSSPSPTPRSSTTSKKAAAAQEAKDTHTSAVYRILHPAQMKYNKLQMEARTAFREKGFGLDVQRRDGLIGDRFKIIQEKGARELGFYELGDTHPELAKMLEELKEASDKAAEERIFPKKMTEETVKSIYKEVAEAMNMPGEDRDYKVEMGVPPTFTLNGQTCQYAGSFTPDTGEVRVYTQGCGTDFIAPAMAHELMHKKFQFARDRFLEEYSYVNSISGPDKTYSSGELKPQYKGKYPYYEALNPMFEDIGELQKDDGITDYSRMWWKAVENGTAQHMSAINETLAEMSRLDWEGDLGRLVWYKESKSYKPMYEAINKLYDKYIKGRK